MLPEEAYFSVQETLTSHPILLEDPECERRFPDSLTMSFSDDFIPECLGDELVEQFMRTDCYRSWVDPIKSMSHVFASPPIGRRLSIM